MEKTLSIRIQPIRTKILDDVYFNEAIYALRDKLTNKIR